jgi:NADPH-dependent FMN reductase
LKNAIDHASRPYGKSAWQDKPAGVIGVSVGAMGTAMAQQHLRNVLAYPHWASPKRFCRIPIACLIRTDALAKAVKNFCKAGWISMLPGSKRTPLDPTWPVYFDAACIAREISAGSYKKRSAY